MYSPVNHSCHYFFFRVGYGGHHDGDVRVVVMLDTNLYHGVDLLSAAAVLRHFSKYPNPNEQCCIKNYAE